MNVSLEGARSQARLDWDRLEETRRASEAVPRRILIAALVIAAAYMLWKFSTG